MLIFDEHCLHAHMCPHGTAACDFGLVKQAMQVDSPPIDDSGGRGSTLCVVCEAAESGRNDDEAAEEDGDEPAPRRPPPAV